MSHDAVEWIPLFPEEEIPFILSTVLRCGSNLRKKFDNERENKLSDRLRLLLVRDPSFRESRLKIDREIQVYRGDTENEDPVGRLDFRFLSPNPIRETDWHFVLEAKRLHVTSPKKGWRSLVSEYVTGDQGMMCFIEERYARGLPNGGMLGYVFDGQVDKARASVGASIAANHRQLKSSPSVFFVPSAVLAGECGISESAHFLPQGTFTIYHLFLAV
jgi:hypothetical protein